MGTPHCGAPLDFAKRTNRFSAVSTHFSPHILHAANPLRHADARSAIPALSATTISEGRMVPAHANRDPKQFMWTGHGSEERLEQLEEVSESIAMGPNSL